MQMKGNREKLRGWNYQGSLLADQQTLNDQWLGWKTFEQADSILVQQHLTGRNQLLYTTKDARWTWGLQHLETTSLNALSLGYEQRSDAYWSPLIRYQWNSDTQLQPSYKQGVKQVAISSSIFSRSSFGGEFFCVIVINSYKVLTKFRTVLPYKYETHSPTAETIPY